MSLLVILLIILSELIEFSFLKFRYFLGFKFLLWFLKYAYYSHIPRLCMCVWHYCYFTFLSMLLLIFIYFASFYVGRSNSMCSFDLILGCYIWIGTILRYP